METSAPKRRKTSPTNAVPVPAPVLPSGSAAGSTTPTRHGAGALPSRTRRIAQRPSPRPLPPPPTEEEEPIDPFRGRVLHRSPPTGVLPTVPVVPDEEPELPPTPTEKGITDPASLNTSPAGIHNTPSKRALRSKAALTEKLKSSPLKQPPLRPSDFTQLPPKASSRPLSNRYHSHYHSYDHSQTGDDQVGDTSDAIHEDAVHEATENPTDPDQTPAPHPSRQIKEPDPNAEQKATRDSLLAEIARLSGDIDFVARENERLQRPQSGGKSQRELWPVKDKRNLLGLLRRHILPSTREPPSTKGADELLFAALNPISFLPFSKADQAMPAFFDAPRPQPEGDEEKNPPVSHYPIPLPAEEELPYLQAFAPLAFTSKVSILPRDESDTAKPLLQRHTISVSSNPPGLFAARVQMTVNTKNLSVAELSVPQLDPSASRELRPFIDRLIHGRHNNSALNRNVSVITWAMGEWVRLATRRARFWCLVERDLASREGIAKCVKRMRKGGKRGAADLDTDEEDDEDGAMGEPTKIGSEKSRIRRADLARYLGKSSFDLDLPGLDSAGDTPSIRIQWTIELDWTGEARSKMGLFVAVPARCKSTSSIQPLRPPSPPAALFPYCRHAI